MLPTPTGAAAANASSEGSQRQRRKRKRKSRKTSADGSHPGQGRSSSGIPGGVAAYIRARIERAEAREVAERAQADGPRCFQGEHRAGQETGSSPPCQEAQLRRPVPLHEEPMEAEAETGVERESSPSPSSSAASESISVCSIKVERDSEAEGEAEERRASRVSQEDRRRAARTVQDWLALVRSLREYSPETRRRVLRVAAEEAAVASSRR